MRRRPAAFSTPPSNTKPQFQTDDHKSLLPFLFPSSLFSSEKKVWALCVAFRALNSFLVQTYFDPDEHWQALEVAHRVAFGYGHLTWEWEKGIRGYLHPMIFVALYKVLAFLRLDTPWFMIRAPRLLQSVFSSIGDLYLYKLAHLIFNEHVARWTLFCQLTNWFLFFCIPRTYSNCLEAVLTTLGLFYWFSSKNFPQQSETARRKLGFLVAALACTVRPTSAITWMYVGILSLFWTSKKMNLLFLEMVPIGALVFALSCILDRIMYGSWVVVPLNFLKFNFLSSGGDYYGTHKWHWYFSQGFPAMVFTFLPFLIHGIYKSREWKFTGLIVWVLGIYSTIGHKEFRFVLPMLPVAMMFSGYSLSEISCCLLIVKPSGAHKKRRLSMLIIVLFLVVTNLCMALYTSLIHQRGREDVMIYLANEAHEGKVKNILFLMPCHSTPYYSTLHYKLPMQFLDCSPIYEKGVLADSDQFKMNPVSFVSNMVMNWSLPSHIVLFDSEERKLRDFLQSHAFREVRRFFNAHFPVGDVLQAFVSVYVVNEQQ